MKWENEHGEIMRIRPFAQDSQTDVKPSNAVRLRFSIYR